MTTTTDRPVQEASSTPPAPGRFPRLSDRGLAVAFISPALLLLLGMSVFPLLWALYLSFTDYSATRDTAGRLRRLRQLHRHPDLVSRCTRVR